jgi:hypothetical protein
MAGWESRPALVAEKLVLRESWINRIEVYEAYSALTPPGGDWARRPGP